MSLKFNILIGDQGLHLYADVSCLKNLQISDSILNSPDKINEVSITKDLVIITTEDPDFRYGAQQAPLIKNSRKINNINIYDWKGNHLWNIADVVGDIKMAFWGGDVVSKCFLKETFNLSDSELIEGHSFYTCSAGAKGYVIDLTDRKICHTYPVK